MDIRRALQVFDLDAAASPAVIKQRYYDLASVWHPDRHYGNARLQKVASEKMKELNSAYEIICAYLENQMIIACHACGAENRKRADFTSDYAACRTCGKQLRKPSPRKKKQPCGNERCAGSIGATGRCDYCGKSIAEGRISAASRPEDPREAGTRSPHSIRSPARGGFGKKAAAGFFASVFLSLILVAYVVITSETNHLPASDTESAAARRAEPTPASHLVARPPLILKSNFQPPAQDDSYYRALFADNKINPEDAVRLQHALRTLGYKTGKPDGVIDTNTVSGLKQYSADFGYVPQENFPACFFQSALVHCQITATHQDWPVIYLSGELAAWIHAQPDEYRRQIVTMVSERPHTAIQLLRRYKFEKYKPFPILLPETGVVQKKFSGSGSRLRIITKTESNHYLIKLFAIHDHQEILSAFIRSGSTLAVQVPPGVYELKYAAGKNWYGPEYLFGTSTSYAMLRYPIAVDEKKAPAGGNTIELTPIHRGHLTAAVISEFDF